MTSAPCSARMRPAAGPATMFEKSSTRTPSSIARDVKSGSASGPAPGPESLGAGRSIGRSIGGSMGRSMGGASHAKSSAAAVPARSPGDRTASFSMERNRPGWRTGPRAGSARSVVIPASRRAGSASHSALVRTMDAGTLAARIIASHSLAGRALAAFAMRSIRRSRHAGVRLGPLVYIVARVVLHIGGLAHHPLGNDPVVDAEDPGGRRGSGRRGRARRRRVSVRPRTRRS